MEDTRKVDQKDSKKKSLNVEQCKRRLAALWFISAGCLFLVFVGQTIGGHYHQYTSEAWGWFLPTIMPTLSLIIGVLVIENRNRQYNKRKADRFLYGLSFWLSNVYLFSVMLTIFAQPFIALPPLKLMNQSNFWLSPLQGLVAASLGAFFVKREAS